MPKPIQQLQNVWKTINVVSSVRDLAVDAKTYQWDVSPPVTFFMDAEQSDMVFKHHDLPIIQVVSELQAGFGWQIATEQDSAGVYIVAKRKPIIGTIGRGKFIIMLPHNTHISLKLKQCRLTLDDLSTHLEFSPNQVSNDS